LANKKLIVYFQPLIARNKDVDIKITQRFAKIDVKIKRFLICFDLVAHELSVSGTNNQAAAHFVVAAWPS